MAQVSRQRQIETRFHNANVAITLAQIALNASQDLTISGIAVFSLVFTGRGVRQQCR
jgi:hypothetical protein